MIPETTTMMLRASALMNISPAMLFVGVYETETFTPIALVDRDKVQINPDADVYQTRTFDIVLNPDEVKAIAVHIRTKDNPFVKINIANLCFVCLRTGSGCMTGMSNFNMEYDSDNTGYVKDTLFNMSRRHYESEELLSGTHALQISAILKEEVIVIGLCHSGTSCSSLKLIREILDQAPEQPSEKVSFPSDGNKKISFTSKSASLRASLKSFSSLIDQGGPQSVAASQDSVNKIASSGGSISSLLESFDFEDQKQGREEASVAGYLVDRRASTKTTEDRRREQFKRETEFCDDWRTTTIKSIEALRMIGQVSPDRQADDKRPLMESIENVAETSSRNSDTYSDGEDAARQKWASKKKRPSRSTFV